MNREPSTARTPGKLVALRLTTLILAGSVGAMLSAPALADKAPVHIYADKAQVPSQCHELKEVSGKSGGPLKAIFMSDSHIKHATRRHLIDATRDAGGNALVITEHRDFKGPDRNSGLERSEEKGLAYRCPTVAKDQ